MCVKAQHLGVCVCVCVWEGGEKGSKRIIYAWSQNATMFPSVLRVNTPHDNMQYGYHTHTHTMDVVCLYE